MKKKILIVLLFLLCLSLLLIRFRYSLKNQKDLYFNKSQVSVFHTFDMLEFLVKNFIEEKFTVDDVRTFFQNKENSSYEIIILRPDKTEFYNTKNLKNPISPSTYKDIVFSKLDHPLSMFSFDFIVDNKMYLSFIKKTVINEEVWYLIINSEHTEFYESYKFWRAVWLVFYVMILTLIFALVLYLQKFLKYKKAYLIIKNKEENSLCNFIENDTVSMSLVLDSEANIKAVSRRLLNFLKFTKDELQGYPIKSLIQNFNIFDFIYNSNKYVSELSLIDKYKHSKEVLMNVIPFFKDSSENQEVEKFLISFNDLSIIKENNSRLEKEINKNQILTKIAQMITISNDPKQIIQTIIEETRYLIDYDSGTLFLLDENELIPYYTNNKNLQNVLKDIRLKVGQGLTGLVAKIKKGMIVNDAENSPIAFSIDDTPEIEECLISSPLINNNKLIGVVTFSREGNRFFTDEDLKILELLSVQAAAILDNSILLNKLKDSENKYYALINESALGIVILKNRKISFSNKRFSKFLNMSIKDLIGKDIVEFISHKDKSFFASQLTTFLLDGKTEVFEIEFVDANNQILMFEFSLSTVLWENSDSILITVSNVTEKVELNKQLLQTQKLESVGALASGIAHDFKNVLSGIIGAADMIMLKTSDLSPVNNFAKIIKSSAERGSKLAQRLLGFSRKEDYDNQTFDINELLNEVVEIISYTFEKNIEITRNLSNKSLSFEGDSVKIQQCLLNLCVNARDAMQDGGNLIIESSILDNLYNEQSQNIQDFILNGELVIDKKYNFIKISDTGSGIPEEIRESIFEAFFTTKEKGKGTGLGLSTTKNIIKEYKGVIYLESEINKGTTFSILLPWTQHIEPESEQLSQISELKPHNVLLVDDEEIVLDVAKDLLEELGSNVFAVSNGLDALKLLKINNSIELAIIDKMMPKMDGITLFRKIKSMRPKVKVVIASGFIQSNEVELIKKEGAFDFISKPYHLEDLIKILNNL